MYNPKLAAEYWDNDRWLYTSDPIEVVAGLNRPAFINEGYTEWELSILQKILDQYHPTIIMDLACGVGRFTQALARRNDIQHIYAVDISAKMLEVCQKKLQNHNLVDKVTIICDESTKITLPTKQVDAIICLGLFEHLPPAYQTKTLEKISKLLGPLGVLVLEINNEDSIFLNQNSDNPFRKSIQHDNGYFCNLVEKELIVQTLSKLGFRVINEYKNSFYSLISHFLREICYGREMNNVQGRKWIKISHMLDMYPFDKIPNRISDQIILELIKD